MPSAIGAPGVASAASASTPGHMLLLSPNDPVPNPRVQRLRDEMRNHELNRDLGQSDVGKLVRGYILCRPDRELIIGDGIVGLFGGFVQSEDKNLNEPRWDFVAFRVDDTVARFHPSKINAGKVVIQPLEVFRWEGDVPAQSLVVPPGPPPGASASASTPAPAPPDAPATTRASIRRMPDGSFEGYHAADLISAKQAKAWLKGPLAVTGRRRVLRTWVLRRPRHLVLRRPWPRGGNCRSCHGMSCRSASGTSEGDVQLN